MNIFGSAITTFGVNDDGTTAIEYALLASVIAIGALGGFSALGGAVGNMWNDAMTTISAALGS